MESVKAIETSDPGDGAIAAASFLAIEVDGKGDAVYGHLQGTSVASGKSSGSGSIGGKEGLEFGIALRKNESRYWLGVSTPGRPATCYTVGRKILSAACATSSCASLMASIFREYATAILL